MALKFTGYLRGFNLDSDTDDLTVFIGTADFIDQPFFIGISGNLILVLLAGGLAAERTENRLY